jgi:hypothetical protein
MQETNRTNHNIFIKVGDFQLTILLHKGLLYREVKSV